MESLPLNGAKSSSDDNQAWTKSDANQCDQINEAIASALKPLESNVEKKLDQLIALINAKRREGKQCKETRIQFSKTIHDLRTKNHNTTSLQNI